MSVLLSCPADNSGTASLSGDNGTGPNVGQSLIVDNFIRIQTNQSATPQDILSATSAYSGQNVYPASNAIPYLNKPVWTVNAGLPAYLPVIDQTITLTPGDAVYTFSLMDWGYTYGSSAVWLKTSCKVKDRVCHADNGAKGDKTLILDPNGYAAHLAQHPNDYAGACTDGH
jgi:hypothetical protein